MKLEANKIYRFSDYIVKVKSDGLLNGCYNIQNRRSFHVQGYFSSNFKQSLASEEEKQWLEACIKANKFIPLKDVQMSINYEIY